MDGQLIYCGKGLVQWPEQDQRRGNKSSEGLHTNVTRSMGTSLESPRKKTSRFGRMEQIGEHDDGAGKVLQKGGPDWNGCVRDARNGREWNVDMPENAEGGNEWNGYAEMTNGPGSPGGCKEGADGRSNHLK
ncbi:hypothetical protein DFH07DRAFT_780890 [Mycena maculata]|uniref:Uncharacterized protein n=1 Tax=Mycena maculata TaxID=230809 RepID=A0AAD7MVL5_9AGAR|nr:hypothetical protein DFH07DRAFT_780890 [Mycena maculata]